MVAVYTTHLDPLMNVPGWAWAWIGKQRVRKPCIVNHEYVVLVGSRQFVDTNSVARIQEAIRVTHTYCNNLLYIGDIMY